LVVSDTIYWAASNMVHVTVPGVDDSGPILIQSTQPQQITADATHIYWTWESGVSRAPK
jgi:hypothetical protein